MRFKIPGHCLSRSSSGLIPLTFHFRKAFSDQELEESDEYGYNCFAHLLHLLIIDQSSPERFQSVSMQFRNGSKHNLIDLIALWHPSICSAFLLTANGLEVYTVD